MATKYCPKCQQTYPSPQRLCSADQEVLSLKDPYHLVGRVLMDKYRIDALVGLGGMGAVYCAHHLGIDRRVALKILQPNIATGDEHVVKMFEREAKLAGRLTHENIIDVKDAGHTDEGISYIVMEWLEGNTLDEELMLRGRLGFVRAASLARQIAVALGEAHKNHIIHRDLKPGNVMLVPLPDRRELVKVLDFGISKALNHTAGTSVSAIVGTPHYASPEQLTFGGQIDGRSDIYSLGVILYRMLSGQMPFKCNSMGELIQMQMTYAPPPLRSLRPETPPEFEQLVDRMIARDPAQRPLNTGEVITLLDQVINHSEFAEYETNELPGTLPTGETTIERRRELSQQTTEEMPHIARPFKSEINATDYSTSVLGQSNSTPCTRPSMRTARSFKSHLLFGSTVVVALAAAGYGIYRYTANDAKSNSSGPSGLEGKQAAANPTSPSPAVAVKSVPQSSPTPIPAADPTPRLEQNPAQEQRNQRLAENHYRKAEAFYKQGKYVAARRESNNALKLSPGHAQARDLKRRIRDIKRILKEQ